MTTNGTAAPWRIYLYGAGSIAWRHGVAAQSLGADAQLFAADPSEASREALKAKCPNVTLFEDGESMLSSSEGQARDIVVIACPPFLHHSATIAAFKSKRHVLCEKPLARNQTELDEMLAAGDAAGRIFSECSYRYLGNGALNQARKVIDNGGIGSVYHASFINRQTRSRPGIEYQPASKWFLNKEKSGGGTIFDWGVYDLTMFFDVLRPVKATIHHAWTATPKTSIDPPEHPITVETHAGASMTLTLGNGTSIPFYWERASGFHGEPRSSINVDGSTGGLSWEWVPTFDYKEEVDPLEQGFKLTQFADANGEVEAKEQKFEAFGWENANLRPLLAFVDLIEGKESVALDRKRLEFNFGVVLGMYKCAEEKKPVTVELK
ncbi:oxidoreductase family, NAD-binding rossmann fold domain-containing protein [Sarocladium implicatum]|nr:oxidoreductase family, NAD-binding rossmann fold domain-containing protein [Sarocladium implicatum]